MSSVLGVYPTPEERERVVELIGSGRASARAITRAQIRWEMPGLRWIRCRYRWITQLVWVSRRTVTF